MSKFVFSIAFLFALAPTLLAGQHNSGNPSLPYPDCLQHALELGRQTGKYKSVPLPRRMAASALSLDGSLMAFAMADSFWSTLAAFDAASGRQLWRADVATEPDTIKLSPDGRVLAITYVSYSICGQPSLELRDARTGAKLPALQEESADGYSGVNDDDVPDVTFSSDGSLVAASVGSEMRVWDVASGKNRLLIHNPGFYARHGPIRIFSLSFSPDATLLAATGQDNKIYLWRVRDGKPIKSFHDARDGLGYGALIFSPDGKWLATPSAGPIRIWRVADGILAGSLGAGTRMDVRDSMGMPEPIEVRESIVGFTRNGERLITQTDDETNQRRLEVWDMNQLKRGKPLFSYELSNGAAGYLLPSGRIILAGFAETEGIQLTDLDTGKKLSTLILPERAPEPWFHQGAPQTSGAAQKEQGATPRQ